MGVPQNGLFTTENPIVMDDLGVPPFLETTKWFPYVTSVMFSSIFHNISSVLGRNIEHQL